MQTDVQLAAAGVAAAAGLYFFYSSSSAHDGSSTTTDSDSDHVVAKTVKDIFDPDRPLVDKHEGAFSTMHIRSYVTNDKCELVDPSTGKPYPPIEEKSTGKEALDFVGTAFASILHPSGAMDKANEMTAEQIDKNIRGKTLAECYAKKANARMLVLSKVRLDMKVALKQVLDAPSDRLAKASRIMFERVIDSNAALSVTEKSQFKSEFESQIASGMALHHLGTQVEKQANAIATANTKALNDLNATVRKDAEAIATARTKALADLKAQELNQAIDMARAKYTRTLGDKAAAEAAMSAIDKNSPLDKFYAAQEKLAIAKTDVSVAKANLDKLKAELGH